MSVPEVRLILAVIIVNMMKMTMRLRVEPLQVVEYGSLVGVGEGADKMRGAILERPPGFGEPTVVVGILFVEVGAEVEGGLIRMRIRRESRPDAAILVNARAERFEKAFPDDPLGPSRDGLPDAQSPDVPHGQSRLLINQRLKGIERLIKTVLMNVDDAMATGQKFREGSYACLLAVVNKKAAREECSRVGRVDITEGDPLLPQNQFEARRRFPEQ